MRTWKRHIASLATAGAVAGAVLAPAAVAKFDAPSPDSRPPACASWARWMSYQLAHFGIFGAQADSYIAQRLDNPCHDPITPRSSFHAGDPA
jgi:hypothetical protein